MFTFPPKFDFPSEFLNQSLPVCVCNYPSQTNRDHLLHLLLYIGCLFQDQHIRVHCCDDHVYHQSSSLHYLDFHCYFNSHTTIFLPEILLIQPLLHDAPLELCHHLVHLDIQDRCFDFQKKSQLEYHFVEAFLYLHHQHLRH